MFCFTCSCFSKNYWLSLNPSTAITTFKTITKNTMNILISSYHSTVAHHSHAQTIPRGSLAIVLGPCESNSSAFFICSKWAFLAFRHLWIIIRPNPMCKIKDSPIKTSRGVKNLYAGSPSNTARSWDTFAAISDASQNPRTMFCLSAKTFPEGLLLLVPSVS